MKRNTAFDDLFNDFFAGTSNEFLKQYSHNKHIVKNIDDKYSITIELPGFDKSEIDVQYFANYISVVAKSSSKDFTNLYSKEFRLPYDVSLDNIYAKLKNGILTITCTKANKTTSSRKIMVSE